MGPDFNQGERYAHNGVMLRCDKGVVPGLLTVLPRPSHVNGQFQANTGDCLPLVNIPPFGACAVTHGPCLPPTLLWTGAHTGAKKVGLLPPVLASSVCQCALGGRISITMPPAPGSINIPSPEQKAAEQDAKWHEKSNTLKELAGGLALVGLASAVGGLFFPPLEIVATVALIAAEGLFLAAIVIDVAVAVVHPSVDNWLVVVGDVLAVGVGYALGKVVVGPAMGALARGAARMQARELGTVVLPQTLTAGQGAIAEGAAARAAAEKLAAEAAAAKAAADKLAAKAQSYEELGQKPPCFLAGTLIQTLTGPRPIEQLAPGDLVLAYDFATSQVVARPVLGTMRNWTRFVVALTLGGERVRTTRQHRFWSPVVREWVAAAELAVGMPVLTVAGSHQVVEQRQVYEAEAETYNFEVAELHNYFVGTLGTLVHNDKQPPKPKAPSKYTYTTRTPTRIYEVYDPKTGKVVYVGKTEQTINARMAQHLKNVNKTHWEKNKYKIRLAREGNWTEYETATWEHHYIEKNGGKANLENRQVGIDKVKYQEYGKPQYGHKPCP